MSERVEHLDKERKNEPYAARMYDDLIAQVQAEYDALSPEMRDACNREDMLAVFCHKTIPV